jgi:tetratricopeptide (TPR) repeat protein
LEIETMNRTSLRIGMVMSVAIASSSQAHACLWDYDTLKQERARFPDTLEIITGKFLRHSKEFYEWRIKDRLKRLETDPKNPALYDDLAVAYEKTGQNPKAIKTMLKVEEFAPGRYETYSNLGAFYFLGGDLKKGLEYVDKALAINPDAHFGREKYQKYLTEYVIERSKDGKIVLPLRWKTERIESFSFYLQRKLQPTTGRERMSLEDYQAAVKGVLGMMRFAYFDSPVLLEVLGDLLSDNPRIDGKQLAARAYLQAASSAKTAEQKADYRELASFVLMMQTRHPGTEKPLPLSELEEDFRSELEDASKWYAELRSREIGWIRDGQDPEVEFDRLYTEEPRIPGEISANLSFTEELSTLFVYWKIKLLLISPLLLLLIVGCWQFRKHRRKRRAALSDDIQTP